jgi:bacterioferritin
MITHCRCSACIAEFIQWIQSKKGNLMPIIRDEKKRNEIISMLTRAYWMEIETVQNYIANSVNLDGVRAEEIKKSLAADITAEIGHAQQFGKRIKELYGKVPGSFDFKAEQKSLQPPADSTDVVSVIKGVIEAEQGAIDHYTNIIRACQEVDYVTADMVTKILGDEEGHLREFEGFLKEYEKR